MTGQGQACLPLTPVNGRLSGALAPERRAVNTRTYEGTSQVRDDGRRLQCRRIGACGSRLLGPSPSRIPASSRLSISLSFVLFSGMGCDQPPKSPRGAPASRVARPTWSTVQCCAERPGDRGFELAAGDCGSVGTGPRATAGRLAGSGPWLIWRHSTAVSCRSTRSSASLDTAGRASSIRQPSRRAPAGSPPRSSTRDEISPQGWPGAIETSSAQPTGRRLADGRVSVVTCGFTKYAAPTSNASPATWNPADAPEHGVPSSGAVRPRGGHSQGQPLEHSALGDPHARDHIR